MTALAQPFRRALAAVEVPRQPLFLFAASRLVIWGALVLAWLAFESYGSPIGLAYDDRMHDAPYPFQVWARWDSAWFLGIADEGYSYHPNATAYFPLYPSLVAVLGRILAGHFLIAGVLVSLAATGVAFVLLYQLARRFLGAAGAHRTVLYVAVFPMSVFLGAVYSEGLYLMLAVGAFLLAERRNWAAAAALAGLAMLTRTAGVAVLLGVALLAWRSRERMRALASLALAPVIAAAYPLYLLWRTGDPFAFVGPQQEGWARYTTWWGPLEGAGRGLNAGFQGVRQVLAGPESPERYWNWARDTTTPRAAALSVFYAAFLILLVLLSAYAWRRLGAPYGLFCVASLVIPLSAPTRDWPLLSLPRFGLAIFPIFIALAALGARPRLHTAIVVTSTVLLGVMLSQWATYYFVS